MLELLCAIPCADVAVPEATEQAMSYYRSGIALWIVQQVWSLVVPLLFLIKGFTGKLATYARSWGKNWFCSILVYLILFLTIYQALNLPLDFYTDYIREHVYGLSTQSAAKWMTNYGIGFLVTAIGLIAFVWIFYLLLKKSPRRWWFYSFLVTVGIAFIMTFIQPIWIDPLFNRFGPMQNKQLEQQILDLANRVGIHGGRVYEVDMSQETNTLNAYVTGLGSTKRIVLWDTLINRLTTPEILFVMGHEMGHYVLYHMWWWIGFFALLSFTILYLIYRSANYVLKRYQRRLGFKHLSDIASLPLLLFLINFYGLIFTPFVNLFSHHLEHEADRFGLEITHNNQAAAEAFIALVQQNLINPRPGFFYRVWIDGHPSIGERIDFCNSYCPWKQREPSKYINAYPSAEE